MFALLSQPCPPAGKSPRGRVLGMCLMRMGEQHAKAAAVAPGPGVIPRERPSVRGWEEERTSSH